MSEVDRPRGEEKLWAAVIALALHDACAKPKRGIPTCETGTAIDFLFSPGSSLDNYAEMLNFDVARFRERLLNAMYSDPVLPVGQLTDAQVRAMRINYETMLHFHALQGSREES